MGKNKSKNISAQESSSLFVSGEESESIFHAVFEDGCLSFINESAQEFFDVSCSSSFSLVDLLDLIHPEDRKNYVRDIDFKGRNVIKVAGSGPVRLLSDIEEGEWVNFKGESFGCKEKYITTISIGSVEGALYKLKALEERNKILVDAVEVFKEPFYIFNAESCDILFANQAGKAELQGEPGFFCYGRDSDQNCSLERDVDSCPVFLTRKSQLPSIVEKRFIGKDGREKFCEIRGHPVFDAEGRVIRIIAHQINITARKRMEGLLRESEERYTNIFENSHSVILLIDPDNGRILDVNPAASKFYGYSRKEFRTMNISDLDILPSEETLARIREQIKGGADTDVFRHRLKDGHVRSVETTVGKIIISRKEYAYSIITDVTKRQKAEIELKHRYEFESIIKSLATKFINLRAEELDAGVLYSLMKVGEFASVDHSFIILLSGDRTKVVKTHSWWKGGKSLYTNYPGPLNPEAYPWAFHRIRMGLPLTLNSLEELPAAAGAEKKRWSDLGIKSLLSVPLGSKERMLGFYGFECCRMEHVWTEEDKSLLNISAQMYVNTMERMHFEKQLEDSMDSLKFLSAHTQEKVEEVRANIAREVHDELGQLLTALKFDVAWLKGKMESGSTLSAKCDTMSDILDDAVTSVQRISSELRPVLLDDLGLAAAIEWSAREFSERTGIACNLGLDEVDIQGQISISLFRVAQEALTNIARHSYATELEIQLNAAEKGINLSIKDNGIGITPNQLSDGASYGIMGLKERISALEGTVEIVGEKGVGTTIKVWIPYGGEGGR